MGWRESGAAEPAARRAFDSVPRPVYPRPVCMIAPLTSTAPETGAGRPLWIKLISPRMSKRPMDSAWKIRMSPPLALLTLAALTPAGHRVTLEDENIESPRPDERPDLVGLTVKADTFPRACAISAGYRARGIPVVFGGIHPTACPADCVPHADAVVIGEAEPLWAQILRDVQAGTLQPRYQAGSPVDPATVPIPAWHLLHDKDYLFTNTIYAGRGCPWRCDFCYNSSPNLDARHRAKPVPHLLREIESLGTDHVMFIDDNFIGSPGHARELLHALRPLGLTWHTAVSADIGRQPELLDLMAASGCRSLFIGFETLNQDNLLACRKRQNQAAAFADTIREIHRRGIMVNASIVFGFDGDGPGVFDATVDWLEAHRVATMTAHILTPYPGTRFYRQLDQAGRILDRDLRHYNTSRAVFRPAGMSPAELEAGYLRAYRRFYSFRSIWRRRPRTPAQRRAYFEFNLLYRKFGSVTCHLGAVFGRRNLARLARRIAYPARKPAS